jgi:hypothetical protein
MRVNTMLKMAPTRKSQSVKIVSLVVLLIAMMALTFQLTQASSPYQEDDPPAPTAEAKDCKECHLDIANLWTHSPHAHAFDDPEFQERWLGMGQTGECLLCHTTNYQSTSGDFTAEGVDCEACHGSVGSEHPPAPAPILADTEYCGTCHTTTLGEWRLTGHATADVGCADCHDPHNQQALFEVPDEMCLNCHGEDMGAYLEDMHVQKDIGCVDCHALVIPPEKMPEDGIVPTGHTFTITPATCVACHTDALHAGFSLPGYENGAQNANGTDSEGGEAAQLTSLRFQGPAFEERIQELETQLETNQAALASSNMTILFQGGVVGLVLGGSTAWIVAQNVRRRQSESDNGQFREEDTSP